MTRLVGFAVRRYTEKEQIPGSAIYAWQLLGNSVYKDNPYGGDSIMLRRPRLYREQDVRFFSKTIALRKFFS